MTDDEIIAVVRAHKEGKTIQYRKLHGPRIWNEEGWVNHPFGNIEWHFVSIEYRVAPEPRKPREWKIPITANGGVAYTANGGVAYLTTEPITIVRVREVID